MHGRDIDIENGASQRHDLLVLGYHAVSDTWRSDLAVTTGALERQLTTLVRRGYRCATFTDAVTTPLDSPTIVVTFDDAFLSVLSLAFPIMTELDLPGTVFVSTDFAEGGQRASWSGVEDHLQRAHAPELEVMSWEDLRRLAAAGWEIGSHTCSHPRLPELGDRELQQELTDSLAQCETHMQRPCRSIAYPYGATEERVIAAAGRVGYEAAAGLPRALHLHPPQRLNWPRIGIFPGDGRVRFTIKVSRVSRRLRTQSA